MSCIDLLGRTWAGAPGQQPAPAWSGWSPPGAPASSAAPSAAPPPSPRPPTPNLPDPPPLDGAPLTVDDAWRIFGIPQKRGQAADVKRRYIAFLAKWHPDRHPNDTATATAQFVRAKAAWELLQKHCRWSL
ncbi:MAG TPA: J domain-containing protein [Casimicrobiaceae bacterium]|nr:J domain-containing protein [Casimicrobiaceae bacterium]